MLTEEQRIEPEFKISAYNSEGFVINQQMAFGTVCLIPGQAIKTLAINSVVDMTEQDFAALLDFECKLIIIGTGPKLIIPKQQMYQALINQQVGVEFMSSAAACRTFALLSQEERAMILILFSLKHE